jgi:hypothetical protein
MQVELLMRKATKPGAVEQEIAGSSVWAPRVGRGIGSREQNMHLDVPSEQTAAV